jgi:phospho-N-acetylmuramoyl-pentapeptide-transferase
MIETDIFSDELTKMLLLGLIGFIVAMALTPIYTYYAYKYNFWKKKRTTAATGEKLEVIAKLSTRKRRVPTMAGVIMVVAAAIVTLIFNLSREQTWLPLAALAGGGFVGLLDDIINVRGDGSGVAGLRTSVKFGLITLVAAIGAWFFYYKLGYSTLHVPFFGDLTFGLFIMPIFVLAVVSTSNAVNISDGLDGLAGGLLTTSYAAFGIIAALQGNYGIAAFCMTVAGTLLAYVWFNIPPARFFMGDVGSFALGTSLGVVAMLTDTLLLLPIIGLIFVLEAGSSLLQILSKKLFHRRIFIAAPLHHHLEAGGWEKTKVTMRFWIIAQACALIGITVALVGGS